MAEKVCANVTKQTKFPPTNFYLRWKREREDILLPPALAFSILEDELSKHLEPQKPKPQVDTLSFDLVAQWSEICRQSTQGQEYQLAGFALLRYCVKWALPLAPLEFQATISKALSGPFGLFVATNVTFVKNDESQEQNENNVNHDKNQKYEESENVVLLDLRTFPADYASFAPLSASEDEWITVHQCGHWKDERIIKTFTKMFGTQDRDWRWGYRWHGVLLDNRTGIQLYEEAYLAALQRDENRLLDFVQKYSEVFDTSLTNIESFCDYSCQESTGFGQHWQDISVRRCLLRLQKWFQGEKPLEIRGHTSEGFCLNPSELEFFWPESIQVPRQFGWWKPGSIEDFSMSSFVVQAHFSQVVAFLRSQIKPSGTGHSQEALETILYAQTPKLLPLMCEFALLGNKRTQLFIALTCSLMAHLLPSELALEETKVQSGNNTEKCKSNNNNNNENEKRNSNNNNNNEIFAEDEYSKRELEIEQYILDKLSNAEGQQATEFQAACAFVKRCSTLKIEENLHRLLYYEARIRQAVLPHIAKTLNQTLDDKSHLIFFFGLLVQDPVKAIRNWKMHNWKE